MSFSLTEKQVRDRTKTVTRRLGWKNLLPGTEINAVHKCMGLRKGEKPILIAKIRIKAARREPLENVTPEDVIAEGFEAPPIFGSPILFVDMFCRHMKVTPETVITRIEFEYIEKSLPAHAL